MEGNTGLIIFPEGTRSRDGSMSEFKPGLGMLVAGSSVPVIPCHIAGSFQAMPPNCTIPRPEKLRVRVGPPLTFANQPDGREGWVRVARETEDAVRALGSHRAIEAPGSAGR
jgi:1-acyl-sn-glycerol-3-phosphate acyltransferase